MPSGRYYEPPLTKEDVLVISLVVGICLACLFGAGFGLKYLATAAEEARCPEPILIGLSTPPTDFENEVIRGAKIKCGYLYDGACLKKLEQVRPRGFKATCRRQK